jgi:hypothetical protein
MIGKGCLQPKGRLFRFVLAIAHILSYLLSFEPSANGASALRPGMVRFLKTLLAAIRLVPTL